MKAPSRTEKTRGEKAEFDYEESEISHLGSQAKRMNVKYSLNELSEAIGTHQSSSYVERVSVVLSTRERESGSKGIDLGPITNLKFAVRNKRYDRIEEETSKSEGPEVVGISRSALLSFLRGGSLPDYICNIIPKE